MEKRAYRGGVSEERREPLERRAEELGFQDLYWTAIRLGARVDDLEEQLAELRRGERG